MCLGLKHSLQCTGPLGDASSYTSGRVQRGRGRADWPLQKGLPKASPLPVTLAAAGFYITARLFCPCRRLSPQLGWWCEGMRLPVRDPLSCSWHTGTCQALRATLLPPLQGLLKKHEAFETDFTVHKDRVNDVCTNGQDLVKKVSPARRGDLSCPTLTPGMSPKVCTRPVPGPVLCFTKRKIV